MKGLLKGLKAEAVWLWPLGTDASFAGGEDELVGEEIGLGSDGGFAGVVTNCTVGGRRGLALVEAWNRLRVNYLNQENKIDY